MKTVLAPLFRDRNLDVLSWEGFNILGGGDGRVLNDPRHKRSKVLSTGCVLTSILGKAPHAGAAIEYVPSLGNWKTAWDYIHFRGFLGTKMAAQFIWEGCDSILAAPLVLDRGVLSGAAAPEMRALEAEFAALLGGGRCLATNSGTAALHIAIGAVGLQPGDEVIVPALSFIATAQAVLHAGAVPVFADVDPVTYNIDPRAAAARVTPR